MTVDDIPVVVIALRDAIETKTICTNRLREQDVAFTFYNGVNAAELGLKTIHRYTHDDPVNGWDLTHKQVGIWMSHHGLWAALRLALDAGFSSAPAFMICEDDVTFNTDWKQRVNAALASIPDDWQMLYPGSCDCGDSVNQAPCGNGIYRANPLCTHCYIIRSSAIGSLLSKLRTMKAPLDIALFFDAFPSMYAYAILPRVADQVGMKLNP